MFCCVWAKKHLGCLDLYDLRHCIDSFNLAQCVNRRAQRDLLAPIYIEEVKDIPTYMGLVQYIDCR